jgi:hypothetical protein
MLLCYYALHTTQDSLAPLFKFSQTNVSSQLRMAVKTLCAYMSGNPSQERLRACLEAAGEEGGLAAPLSQLIAEYAECRSFVEVADKHGIRRPEVRKAMRKVSDALCAANGAEEQALGAYIWLLIDKASARGTGLTARRRSSMCPIVRSDPDTLGQFRVRVDDPGFDSWFVPKATR